MGLDWSIGLHDGNHGFKGTSGLMCFLLIH